jgi:hypothetical protein
MSGQTATLTRDAVSFQAEMAQPIILPPSFNYIGAFLTFRCPYTCPGCINHFGGPANRSGSEASGRTWIGFFDRLITGNTPITLQGGEPGLHQDFVTIVEHASRTHALDILTNLAFDLEDFIRRVPPARLNREAPYAPIRVSYHPDQFSLAEIVQRVQRLEQAGFRVGLYGVLKPDQLEEIQQAQELCSRLGIDFRTKPFLGWHAGRLYGDYAYPGACAGMSDQRCECAPSELLIGPAGTIHGCHHHLYAGIQPVAYIADPIITISDSFIACDQYGRCNPCDVKVKNNRFQQFGHVAVRIRMTNGGVIV